MDRIFLAIDKLMEKNETLNDVYCAFLVLLFFVTGSFIVAYYKITGRK